MHLVPSDSLGTTLETKREFSFQVHSLGSHSEDKEGVSIVPGDSLGATMDTRRECVSFQVTV